MVCCEKLQLYAERDGEELLPDGIPVGKAGFQVVFVADADEDEFDADVKTGGQLALVASQGVFPVTDIVF